MGWWVVLQPSGRYARFSDLINDFTEFNLSRAEVVALCRHELQGTEAEARVAAAETNPMRYRQALDRICTTRGADARFARQSEVW